MTRVRVLTLATAALWLAGPASAAPATTPPPARVHLVAQRPGGGGRWVAATLGSARRATLSTRVAASVRAIPVEEGTVVAQGQLLLSLADDDLRAQLAAAETSLASATANERRMAALARERAATPSELEVAQAQRAQAAAAVAAVRANLAYTEIRSPFAGTVQARRVNAGDLVGPGQPLVEIEGSAMEIQASLSETEARGLHAGLRLRFQVGDRQGETEVTALAPGGDLLTHRRALRARVIKAAEGLRSGSFARLELPGQHEHEGAWVPRSALVVRGDLTGVFVAEGGQAHLRWISLGEAEGDRLPVRAGLRPGESVIDAPGALRDGQLVEVARGD